jgi:DNA-binding response OmpR family regulator
MRQGLVRGGEGAGIGLETGVAATSDSSTCDRLSRAWTIKRSMHDAFARATMPPGNKERSCAMHAPATSNDATHAERPHVLVVDDDPEIGVLLSRYLGSHGLRVSVAADGAQLRATMRDNAIDLMLLDLGLPDEDGLTLMRDLRLHWQGPVIIISGRGESVERVVGLELGADDYVTKPFDLRELLARVRSVLRRAQSPSTATPAAPHGFEFDGRRLDVSMRRLANSHDDDVPLTTGEFDLLLALLQRPHQVLTRDQLMDAVHGRQAGPFDRAIDVQIGRLRRKLEVDPANPQLIKSVRGAGYLFAAVVTPF